MAKKSNRQSSFIQKFWLPIILALITLVGTIVTVIGSYLTAGSGAGDNNAGSVSTSFDYQVRVENHIGDPIPNARIILEIGGGKAPLDGVSDSTGLARLFIDSSYAGKPGRMIVEASSYKRFIQNIDLTENSLPKVVQLSPIQ